MTDTPEAKKKQDLKFSCLALASGSTFCLLAHLDHRILLRQQHHVLETDTGLQRNDFRSGWKANMRLTSPTCGRLKLSLFFVMVHGLVNFQLWLTAHKERLLFWQTPKGQFQRRGHGQVTRTSPNVGEQHKEKNGCSQRRWKLWLLEVAIGF